MATGTNSLNQDMLVKVNTMTTGSSTACTASTLTATQVDHANRVVYLDRAAGIAVTLPAATGTGDIYHFVIKTTASGGNYVVKVANATDVFSGGNAMIEDSTTAAGTAKIWSAAATDDTITMDGSTKGGYAGAYIRCVDYAAGFWAVQAFSKGSGTVATPWSATVS